MRAATIVLIASLATLLTPIAEATNTDHRITVTGFASATTASASTLGSTVDALAPEAMRHARTRAQRAACAEDRKVGEVIQATITGTFSRNKADEDNPEDADTFEVITKADVTFELHGSWAGCPGETPPQSH